MWAAATGNVDIMNMLIHQVRSRQWRGRDGNCCTPVELAVLPQDAVTCLHCNTGLEMQSPWYRLLLDVATDRQAAVKHCGLADLLLVLLQPNSLLSPIVVCLVACCAAAALCCRVWR